jgi:hypothetical protein
MKADGPAHGDKPRPAQPVGETGRQVSASRNQRRHMMTEQARRPRKPRERCIAAWRDLEGLGPDGRPAAWKLIRKYGKPPSGKARTAAVAAGLWPEGRSRGARPRARRLTSEAEQVAGGQWILSSPKRLCEMLAELVRCHDCKEGRGRVNQINSDFGLPPDPEIGTDHG